MEAPNLGSVFTRHLDFPRHAGAQLSAEAFAERLERRHGFDGPRFDPAAWVEHFFDLEHSAEAVERELGWVSAVAGETVLRFDLGEFEYVVIEDENEVVLVSDAGTLVVEKTSRLVSALKAAALPAAQQVRPGGAFKPAGERAFFVGHGGAVVTVDPKLVAEALRGAPVRAEPLARVARASSRLAAFTPAERPRALSAPAPAHAAVVAPVAQAAKLARASGGVAASRVVVVERNRPRVETGTAAARWQHLLGMMARGAPTPRGTGAVALGRETFAVKVGGVTALVQKPASGSVATEAIGRRADALTGGVHSRWLRSLVNERPTSDGFWIKPGQAATLAESFAVRRTPLAAAAAAEQAAVAAAVAVAVGGRAELNIAAADADLVAAPAPEARAAAAGGGWAEWALAHSHEARARAGREAAGELDPAKPSAFPSEQPPARYRVTGPSDVRYSGPLSRADAMPATTLQALYTGLEKTARSAGYRLPSLQVQFADAVAAARTPAGRAKAPASVRAVDVELRRAAAPAAERAAAAAKGAPAAAGTARRAAASAAAPMLLSLPFGRGAGLSVGPELTQQLERALAHRISGTPAPLPGFAAPSFASLLEPAAGRRPLAGIAPDRIGRAPEAAPGLPATFSAPAGSDMIPVAGAAPAPEGSAPGVSAPAGTRTSSPAGTRAAAVATAAGVPAVAAAALRWLPPERKGVEQRLESPEAMVVAREEEELLRPRPAPSFGTTTTAAAAMAADAEPGSIRWVLARASEARAKSRPGKLGTQLEWSVRAPEGAVRAPPERYPSLFISFEPRDGAGDWMLGDEVAPKAPPRMVGGVVADEPQPVPGLIELERATPLRADYEVQPGVLLRPELAAAPDSTTREVRAHYLGADAREIPLSIRLTPLLLADVNTGREPASLPVEGYADAQAESQEIVIPVPLWMQMSEQGAERRPAGGGRAPEGEDRIRLEPTVVGTVPGAAPQAALGAAPGAVRGAGSVAGAASSVGGVGSVAAAALGFAASAAGEGAAGGFGPSAGSGAGVPGVVGGGTGYGTPLGDAAVVGRPGGQALPGGGGSDYVSAGGPAPAGATRSASTSGGGASTRPAESRSTAGGTSSSTSETRAATGERRAAGGRGGAGGRSSWPTLLAAEQRAKPFKRYMPDTSGPPRGYLRFRWPAIARWWAPVGAGSRTYSFNPATGEMVSATGGGAVATALGAAGVVGAAGAAGAAGVLGTRGAPGATPGYASTPSGQLVEQPPAAVPGGALPGQGETAYVAVGADGRTAVVGPQVAGTLRKGAAGSSVDMTVVSAVAPKAPSLDDMVVAGARVHPKSTKGKEAAAKGTAKSDSMSLQGTVDSLAQRIYHRLKRRLQSDRERFGG